MIETCDVLTLGTTFAGAVKGLLGVLLSAHTHAHTCLAIVAQHSYSCLVPAGNTENGMDLSSLIQGYSFP